MSASPTSGTGGEWVVEGRARVVGDRINTDYIISSTRKRESIDPSVLKRWLLEAVDPAFAGSVRPGDILVAGEGFGVGSAMEVAVTVMQAAGIGAVIARSFSRTYFRNAINNGLLPIECDTAGIEEGDRLRAVVGPEGVSVRNLSRGTTHVGVALAPFVLGIVREGGLVPHVRRTSDL